MAEATRSRGPRIWLCPNSFPAVPSQDDDVVVVPKGTPFLAIGLPKVVEMDLDELREYAEVLEGRHVKGYRIVVQR